MGMVGLAGLVTAFQNWQCLKNELMEWTDFLHAVANSEKLNVI